MTTGTLKLASLLIVILTGGGVAWQAQQGILQQPTKPLKTVDEESPDDDLDAALGDPFPTPLDLPAKKLSTAGWNDDSDPSSLELAAGPKKYERKSLPAKSDGAPIPARKSDTISARESKHKTSTKLAFDGEDAAAVAETSAKKNSRRAPLTPIPETEPVPEDETPELALTATDSATETTEDDSAVELPPDGDKVQLVSHEEVRRSKDRKSSKSKEKAPDIDESFGEDPFADSAPPKLDSDSNPDDSSAHAIEMPADSEEQVEEADAFPSLNMLEEDKPSRARRKSVEPLENNDEDFGAEPSALDSAPQLEMTDDKFDDRTDTIDQPESKSPGIQLPTEVDPFGDSDPSLADPSDSESKSTPVEKSLQDEPLKDDPAEKRSTRINKRRDHPPKEATPDLLPVPDATAKEDDTFGQTIDPLENLIDEPQKTPKRTYLEDQPVGDLEEDALPDGSVPKGIQQPRLTIEKIAPKQSVLKQPLVYSVVIKNTGSADAHHVTVEDRIPKGTTLVGTAPQAELFDKRLVWKLGTLKPDEQKKISIKVIPEQQGSIGSVARVNFVAEIAAEIEITAPQLVLNVESASQVRLGDKLHMVFKVRNAGGADAENVVIRNVIPDGLRHPAGADLEYAMGTLAPQETREIQLDLIATKNGKVSNKTIITGDHGLKLDEETPIEVIGEQLLLTRTGKNKVYVDKSAVFTSTIANEGTAAAGKVSVAEVIPAGFEFVSASDHGEFDPATRAVTWMIGPIGPGEELKLSTQLMPKKTGDYRSTITVTGPAGSVATVDAELKVEGHPAVGVDSKIDSRLISVGEKATVRILCKNQGTALARNLILTAELPPELKLVNGKGQTEWSQQGNIVTFAAIPALQPNETASFELQVEGLEEGDTVIEVKFAADHLKRPLQRDETIRVAAGGE